MEDQPQPATWTDLGAGMWSYLTGKEAAINYQFVDMEVAVPSRTGESALAATWRLNGMLRITTDDSSTRQ